MRITDVPNSAIYMQQGAITQLVVQLIDVNSQQPIQLQTATGLSISIRYPDGTSVASFAADLYTDGSDGMLAYTTRNDGASIVDLSQVGLYKIQGNAVLGGVELPPSSLSDFYVLENADGTGSAPPLFNASTLILSDSANVSWGISVNPDGTINAPVLQAILPVSYIHFNQLYMKDSDGLIWSVTVSTTGVLVIAASNHQVDGALESFILNDTGGISWVITMSRAGALQAA